MSEEDEIRRLLARYVRATDRRDGVAQAALFTDDSTTQLYTNVNGDWQPLGEPLVGPDAVRWATENLMQPHPPGGWSHHTTADHLIEVDGDTAHLNAQYVVFEVRADAEPEAGWPAAAAGAQGAVRAIESGYYDCDLRRVDGHWRFARHRVVADLPFVAPATA